MESDAKSADIHHNSRGYNVNNVNVNQKEDDEKHERSEHQQSEYDDRSMVQIDRVNDQQVDQNDSAK